MKHQLRPWLSNLEALEKAATPGPWEWDTYNTLLGPDRKVVFSIPDHPDVVSYYLPDQIAERSAWYKESAANIQLAESVRNFLPRLIAEARKVERLEAIERVAQRMDDMRRVSSAPDRMNHLASCAKNTPGGLLLDCTCGMDALRAALGASE